MKVLVLGGCGFIGSHIVEKLVQQNHEVRVFDRLNASVRNIASVLSDVELVYGDFSDEWATKNALKGCQVVYHLISTTFPGSTLESGVYDLRSNLIPSVKLLENASHNGVTHIIYASSGGTVYGNCKVTPIKESFTEKPTSLYGLSKLTIENYIRFYCMKGKMKYTILRGSNIYGPRQNINGIQGLIAVAIGNLIYNRPQIIWGDGEVYRDYLYVDDFTEALYMCLGRKGHNEVFNVGKGQKTSIKEILDIIRQVTGKDLPVIRKAGRKSDVPCNVLCVDKIESKLGWKPKADINEGIRRTWEWAVTEYGGCNS